MVPPERSRSDVTFGGNVANLYRRFPGRVNVNRERLRKLAAEYESLQKSRIARNSSFYDVAIDAIDEALTAAKKSKEALSGEQRLGFKKSCTATYAMLEQLKRVTEEMRRFAKVSEGEHTASDRRLEDLMLDSAYAMLGYRVNPTTRMFASKTTSDLIEAAFFILDETEKQIQAMSDVNTAGYLKDTVKFLHEDLQSYRNLQQEVKRVDRIMQINTVIQVLGAVACVGLLVAASVGSMGIVPTVIAGAIAAAMLCSIMYAMYQKHKSDQKIATNHSVERTEYAISNLAMAIDINVDSMLLAKPQYDSRPGTPSKEI